MDYSKIINTNAAKIKPSGIRKFFDVVSDMPDAISLGVGEPDFATPWNACAAAVRSINSGHTHYTSNAGMPKLREAVSTYLDNRFNLQYSPNEVLITVGASEAIDLAMRAIVNAGDEVLIPEPSYVSYAPCIMLSGGVPVPIKCRVENKFKITKEDLLSAITPKTKAFILPYPNNPTGAIMTKEDLAPLVNILKDSQIITVSDEIYAELTYGKVHCSIASFENMKERTILINGFSKSFAMTGWRLGYVCAPKELLSPMIKIHQYTIMCASTASQYAGLEAITSGLEDNFASVENMREQYNIRRKFLVSSLNEMGLDCFEPEGAFYVFPSLKRTGMDGEMFAEKLLLSQKVAVVPGSAFGESGKDFVRLSYAYSLKQLQAALQKIDLFLRSLV